MGRLIDLTGRRFGRLTVIERAPNYYKIKRDRSGKIASAKSFVMWRCRCDCGKETTVYAHHLIHGDSGDSRSCGCLRELNGRTFKRCQSLLT